MSVENIPLLLSICGSFSPVVSTLKTKANTHKETPHFGNPVVGGMRLSHPWTEV